MNVLAELTGAMAPLLKTECKVTRLAAAEELDSDCVHMELAGAFRWP